MPSHLKLEDKRPSGVTVLDIKGNDLADKFAKEAAAEVQVPLQVSTNCIHYYSLVKQIQLRIIVVIKHLPARCKHKNVRTPKELAQDLDTILDASKHSIVRNNGRFSCTVCMESFRCNDLSFKHWLDGPCTYLPSSDRPTPIVNNMLHVGNQCIHYSHSLAVHKGLVYCSKCGSRRGANHVMKLAYACEPPSDYGKLSLKAIAEDRLPPNLDEWPSQVSSHIL